MLTDQSRTKLHYIIHYLQPADPHCFNKLRSLRLARAPSSSSNVLRSLYTVLWESMMISHVISRNCYVSARPCPTPPAAALCVISGLSRLPLPAETAVGNPEDSTVVNLMQISSVPVLASDVAIATRKDPVLSKVLVYLRQGWPDEIPEGLQAYFHKRHELSIEGDTILWGMRVVVPSKWRKTVLHELHQGHQGIVRLKQLARSHVWWPKIDQDLEDTVNDCAPCQEHRNTPPKSPLNPWSWPVFSMGTHPCGFCRSCKRADAVCCRRFPL